MLNILWARNVKSSDRLLVPIGRWDSPGLVRQIQVGFSTPSPSYNLDSITVLYNHVQVNSMELQRIEGYNCNIGVETPSPLYQINCFSRKVLSPWKTFWIILEFRFAPCARNPCYPLLKMKKCNAYGISFFCYFPLNQTTFVSLIVRSSGFAPCARNPCYPLRKIESLNGSAILLLIYLIAYGCSLQPTL